MSHSVTGAIGKPFLIFVVEDDLWYGELLVHHLTMNPDNDVRRFETAGELLKQLHLQPDVITLDYTLPDMKGDEVLRRIKNESPSSSVVVISGQENIATAIDLLRKGAYDYLVKDDKTRERLWNSINNIRHNVSLQNEINDLKEQIGKRYEMDKLLIGSCEPMLKIRSLIEKAIKTQITVSISGETGTGKELVAKAIHFNSDRARKSFVAVNVASIPHELLESELFGHEKGAFTGAIARRKGKFEEAHQGTLFLDEIAELDLNLQAKLLRVLQEREVTRVGSNEVIPIDVRIIVATNKNLAEETRNGNFREDLYYRLLGLPISIPPLRERGNDILILAKYFFDEFARANKLPRKGFSTIAKEKLISYSYPGNVRELKAVVELAAVMSDDEVIQPDDITFTSASQLQQNINDDLTLEEYSIQMIRRCLEKSNNNVVDAAKKLGVGKSTIYRMIKQKKI